MPPGAEESESDGSNGSTRERGDRGGLFGDDELEDSDTPSDPDTDESNGSTRERGDRGGIFADFDGSGGSSTSSSGSSGSDRDSSSQSEGATEDEPEEEAQERQEINPGDVSSEFRDAPVEQTDPGGSTRERGDRGGLFAADDEPDREPDHSLDDEREEEPSRGRFGGGATGVPSELSEETETRQVSDGRPEPADELTPEQRQALREEFAADSPLDAEDFTITGVTVGDVEQETPANIRNRFSPEQRRRIREQATADSDVFGPGDIVITGAESGADGLEFEFATAGAEVDVDTDFFARRDAVAELAAEDLEDFEAEDIQVTATEGPGEFDVQIRESALREQAAAEDDRFEPTDFEVVDPEPVDTRGGVGPRSTPGGTEVRPTDAALAQFVADTTDGVSVDDVEVEGGEVRIEQQEIGVSDGEDISLTTGSPEELDEVEIERQLTPEQSFLDDLTGGGVSSTLDAFDDFTAAVTPGDDTPSRQDTADFVTGTLVAPGALTFGAISEGVDRATDTDGILRLTPGVGVRVPDMSEAVEAPSFDSPDRLVTDELAQQARETEGSTEITEGLASGLVRVEAETAALAEETLFDGSSPERIVSQEIAEEAREVEGSSEVSQEVAGTILRADAIAAEEIQSAAAGDLDGPDRIVSAEMAQEAREVDGSSEITERVASGIVRPDAAIAGGIFTAVTPDRERATRIVSEDLAEESREVDGSSEITETAVSGLVRGDVGAVDAVSGAGDAALSGVVSGSETVSSLAPSIQQEGDIVVDDRAERIEGDRVDDGIFQFEEVEAEEVGGAEAAALVAGRAGISAPDVRTRLLAAGVLGASALARDVQNEFEPMESPSELDVGQTQQDVEELGVGATQQDVEEVGVGEGQQNIAEIDVGGAQQEVQELTAGDPTAEADPTELQLSPITIGSQRETDEEQEGGIEGLNELLEEFERAERSRRVDRRVEERMIERGRENAALQEAAEDVGLDEETRFDPDSGLELDDSQRFDPDAPTVTQRGDFDTTRSGPTRQQMRDFVSAQTFSTGQAEESIDIEESTSPELSPEQESSTLRRREEEFVEEKVTESQEALDEFQEIEAIEQTEQQSTFAEQEFRQLQDIQSQERQLALADQEPDEEEDLQFRQEPIELADSDLNDFEQLDSPVVGPTSVDGLQESQLDVSATQEMSLETEAAVDQSLDVAQGMDAVSITEVQAVTAQPTVQEGATEQMNVLEAVTQSATVQSEAMTTSPLTEFANPLQQINQTLQRPIRPTRGGRPPRLDMPRVDDVEIDLVSDRANRRRREFIFELDLDGTGVGVGPGMADVNPPDVDDVGGDFAI